MNTLEAVRQQVKQVKTRVLATVDAFRPKILIKEPLSAILPARAENRVNAEALLERIQMRIQELKSGIGMQEYVPVEEVSGLQFTEEKKGKRGVLY